MRKSFKISAMITAVVIACVIYIFSPLILNVDLMQKTKQFFQKPNIATQQNGWQLILVNADNFLPEDYNISLTKTDNGQFVDKRIFKQLEKMFEAAEKDGVFMRVVSGYRTEAKQQSIMSEKIVVFMHEGYDYFKARQLAEDWVAIPNTSEHQLGLAVDINEDPSKSYAGEVYDWLSENAHKFGFIKRYPHDKVEITGISNEPWHYRYVGIGAACEMKQSNLCLEEYIEKFY